MTLYWQVLFSVVLGLFVLGVIGGFLGSMFGKSDYSGEPFMNVCIALALLVLVLFGSVGLIWRIWR